MKLIVTIEKQKDGTYIAYNTNDDNVTIIGTGDSVSAAKDDFFNSINETIEACEETGLSIPQSLKEEPEFRFDVASLFEYYKLINVSAFAEYIGINASLLRQYKLGSTYISDAQLQKIEDGIHSIGLEFTRLKLVWFTIDEWKECDIALLFLSVAGEKLGFYVKHSIVEIPTLNDRINVAKKIVSALPRIAGILSFDVTFSCTGIHQAHGYIYNGKQHGIIKIDILFGGAYNVKINNGEYTVM